MSDTIVQDCNCCQIETDCIEGLCEMCSDYNYKLRLQDKNKIAALEKKVVAQKAYIEELEAVI